MDSDEAFALFAVGYGVNIKLAIGEDIFKFHIKTANDFVGNENNRRNAKRPE